jgi:membrane-bound lytic murein transglycosylase D
VGGHFIWRKILKILLLFLVSVLYAGADENRPLRSINSNTPLYSLSAPAPAPASRAAGSLITDIILEQPLTQHYIAQYTRPSGIAYLNAVIQRAGLYLPFIKEEIRLRNLPPELAYLPVIESSFVITARSRSGAVGLWQFMLNSISPFNIKANDFIDERRDIIKSTRGALQKLEDNYRVLGNWELALAAYNCGLGGLTRTMQRTGVRDYWELSKINELSGETTHYVPKFMAAAYVLSQPRRFGIDYWPQTLEWTSIPLNRQISLDVLAEESGADINLLRRLNAELLHGVTPADNNHRLKIPTASLQQIRLTLERDDLNLGGYHRHAVRQGDTLWSMARHYGASLDIIEQYNPGITKRYLRVGETVIIPALGDASPVRTAAVHRFDGRHVVTRGDTLWSLGLRYGVDARALAEANDMQLNQILREGRTLRVPIME